MNIWIANCAAAFLLCAFCCGIVIPQILLIAFRKKLLDIPDERKIHRSLVPRLGGIAFLIYGICFFMFDEYFYAMLCFATLGVLVPFFYYNVFGNPDKHKKIFMDFWELHTRRRGSASGRRARRGSGG